VTEKEKSIPTSYLDIVYDEQEKPFSDYPLKLTSYLYDRYEMSEGNKLLDFGCGRGEFLNGFINKGVEGYGVDINDNITKYFPSVNFKTADVVSEGLPYEDDFFDIVFSKSVIEHFHDPEIFIKEIYRTLKPGGFAIVMCPSWEFCYRNYFEDYTHRTPFMKQSLRDIFLMNNFNDINVQFFKQLPILWGPFGKPFALLSFLSQYLLPRSLSSKNKWVRFSKEVMLLGTARKPK